MANSVNAAYFRATGSSNPAAAAAQGRALQATWAPMMSVWYRPGTRTSTITGKAKKAKKTHIKHKHRHHSPMAGQVDPFHNRGAIKGF